MCEEHTTTIGTVADNLAFVTNFHICYMRMTGNLHNFLRVALPH